MARRRDFFKVALLSALMALPVEAQAPDESWRSLSTEHFRVTFPQRLEPLARRAADRAERAYTELSAVFWDPPGGVIDLVVTDHTDIANGFARVSPSNRMTVFARTPVDDLGLGYFDEWIELVVTHELAHLFHLDRAGTLGRLARGIFGRVSDPWPFFPGSATPRWTTEGLATWYESHLTDAGRTSGTYHEMLLRTAALEGRFEELDQASGSSPVWPGGTRAYAYGSLFFEHLLDKFGDDRMDDFAGAIAGQWIPYRLNAASQQAFGSPLSDEWLFWTSAVAAHAQATVADLERFGPVTRPEALTQGARVAFYPRPSPDGATIAYAGADGRSDSEIRGVAADGSAGRRLARTNGLSTFDWTPDGGLLLSQFELDGPWRTYGDLWLVAPGGDERRLTTSARLSQPSVAPDGSWAVAVREGDGTNTLVRVDMVSGALQEILPPDPDVHWSYPSLSPDSRWIAASRWKPGAYSDVVILDLSGREAVALTHDRALDLAPVWSPDGAWLLWTSDRTGIPNVLAASVSPSEERAGEVLLATNVTTGVAYPAVDRAAEWVYVSGYHADGWELERVPFAPGSWPSAPAPDPRFDAPPRPAALQGAAATAEVEPYSPLPTLRPGFWEPVYAEPQRVGALRTDSLFLRGRQVLPGSLGARTSGIDVVGRHAYGAFARVFLDGERFDGGISYSFAGLGNPVLSLGVGQAWVEDGRALGGGVDGVPPDTLFVLERDRTATAALTVERSRWRSNLALSLSAGLAWENRRYLENDLEPSTRYRLRSHLANARLGDFRATLSYASARTYAFQTGSADGMSGFVRGRVRSHFALADSLVDRAGADRSFNEVLSQVRLFRSFRGPGHAAHVFALRASGGYAGGPGADAGHFDVGGAAGTSESFAGLSLFGGSALTFPTRGYPEGARFGRLAWSASAEYRFPLALVNDGLGVVPLHLDRIVGSVFADAGNAWGPELGISGYQNPRRATLSSAGAEVTASILALWNEPFRIRLGAAVPFVGGGGPVAYVRLGLSF